MGKCAALESLGERLPFEVLHDEKIDAVFAPNIVKRADVRMVQRRNRTSFTFQALAELCVIREMAAENFESHDAIEADVLGFVNLPHPAGTDGADDLIGTEASTATERHRDNLATLGMRFNRDGARDSGYAHEH